jgi:hypothetical protein
MDDKQMREAFEAWAQGKMMIRDAQGNRCYEAHAETCWEVWQAAYAAGMGRAAAALDAEAKQAFSNGAWEVHSRLRRVAHAIRAESKEKG